MLTTSLAVALGGATLAVAFALFLVVVGFYSSPRSQRLTRACLTGSLFVPTYVVAGAWTAGFGLQGWWPIWIPSLSPVSVAGKPVLAVLVVIWIYGVSLAPLAFILLRLGLRGASHSDWVLSQMEGGIWSGIWRGFWPNLSAWMGVSIGLLAGIISTDMFVTNLFQVSTITERSYQDIISGKTNTATILSSAFLSWGIILALCASRLTKRLAHPTSTNDQVPKEADMIVPTITRWISEALLWTSVGLVTLVPWTNLILKAGWIAAQHEPSSIRYHWSLSQAFRVTMRAPSAFAVEFYWSGCLGAVASLVAVLIGVLSIWLIQRLPKGFLRPTAVMVIAAFFLPGPTVNQLVMTLMQTDWFDWWNDNTLIAPILCLQFRLIPIVVAWTFWFTIQWRQRYKSTWTIDRNLTARARLRILVLPVGWSIMRLSLILFIVSSSDLSTYILCLPPGVTTISMRVFELLHYGVRFQEAGLLLFIAFAGLLLGLASTWMEQFVPNKQLREENSWI